MVMPKKFGLLEASLDPGEQLEKARLELSNGDYSDVVERCYSVIEAVSEYEIKGISDTYLAED